jgi:hypothetical protein
LGEDDENEVTDTKQTGKVNIIEEVAQKPYVQYNNRNNNNIEDEMFKQYYGKKVYKNNDKKYKNKQVYNRCRH